MNCTFYIQRLHVITYKREYINIVNSCNFFLSKLEEIKSCIYCIKAAYTWVRLRRRWHHLLVVLVVEKTVLFTTKRVCKIQIVSEICNHDPMFNLHFAGLRVDNSKSAIIESWNIVWGTHIWKDRKSNNLPKERKPRHKRSCQSLSVTAAASLPCVHTPYLPSACGSLLRLPYTVLT